MIHGPAVFEGASFAMLLRDAAERWPDAVAILDRERSTTYGELLDCAAAAAESLIDARVLPGDRVGILIERGAMAAAAYFGALAAGCVPVILNEGLRHRQIAYTLEHCAAAALMTTSARLAIGRPPIPNGARLLTVPDHGRAGRFEAADRKGSDPAQIIYTSGSTGLSKGVTLSHVNLWANVWAVTGYLGLSSADRVISLLSFSSVYGLNQLICSVARGSTLVVERSPLISAILETVEQQAVNVLAAVPPLWLQIVRSPRFFEVAGTLTQLQNAGGHLPEHVVRAIRAGVPHAKLFLMYGLTEAFRSTYLDPREVDRRPTSIGRAMPGTEILVLREDGSRCGPGETGELVQRGPTVALGYWNDPEATARTFVSPPSAFTATQDRAVRSGDLVRTDEEGFLYYVGRRDRMIKSMGYRVGPDEVTEMLFASGEVAEAVVSSEPDEIAGMAIIAHVVLCDDGSVDRLRAFCRREMPRYLQPKRIEVRSSIPRLVGGKYDLSALTGLRKGSRASRADVEIPSLRTPQ